MGMVIEQYDIVLIDLDPTQGREMQKTRPCLVISPNEMNRTIGTVIIAPMTTKSHDYPTRVTVNFQNKQGWIVLDQIMTVDKRMLIKKLGILGDAEVQRTKETLREMLVD